jgi:hypothetical protein
MAKHPVQLLLAMAIADAVIDAEREGRIFDFEARARRLRDAHPEARAKAADIAEVLIEEKTAAILDAVPRGHGSNG